MRAHTQVLWPSGFFCPSLLVVRADASIPQGAVQPGPPAPRMQMPARDGAAAEAPTGTARIRGRVVAADNGIPLRRAQVRVSAAELRINRSVNTDAEGTLRILRAARGPLQHLRRAKRIRLAAVRTAAAIRERAAARRRQCADRRKIDFALPRGGVIAGRVTDELGEPLAGVRMQAMRYQYLPNGQRQLTPVGGPRSYLSARTILENSGCTA